MDLNGALWQQGLAEIVCHVIHRALSPCLLSYMEPYDVACNILQALPERIATSLRTTAVRSSSAILGSLRQGLAVMTKCVKPLRHLVCLSTT